MGRKKYFCDYCQRSFIDDGKARTLHLQSASHKNQRDDHYRLFKDPVETLQEELSKKPCRVFSNEGYCRFGFSCRFSHLSSDEIESLKLQVLKRDLPQQFPRLSEFLQSRITKNSENKNSGLSHALPSWTSEVNLPPSLQPFKIEDYLQSDDLVWGT